MKKYLSLLIIPAIFMVSCTDNDTSSSLNHSEIISENISIESIGTTYDEFSEEVSIEVSIENELSESIEESIEQSSVVSVEDLISTENSADISSESISSSEDVSENEEISSSSNNVTTGDIDLPWLP